MASSFLELVELLNRSGCPEQGMACLLEAEMSLEQLAPYIRFTSDRYARNVVARTANFELVVIYWSGHQRSAVHGHGHSVCAFKCVSGELLERRYSVLAEFGSDYRCKSESSVRSGDFSVCYKGSDHHEIINSTEDQAISVHLYAPPLCM